MKTLHAIAILSVCALLLAAPLAAQEDIEIRTGKVVKRVGQTLVVRVTDGSHLGNQVFKFNSKSNVKIFNENGEQISVFDIEEGDNLVGVRITTAVAPTTATDAEVAAMTSAASDELPHTAGQSGILVISGLALLAIGLGLGRRRQSA